MEQNNRIAVLRRQTNQWNGSVDALAYNDNGKNGHDKLLLLLLVTDKHDQRFCARPARWVRFSRAGRAR